MLLRFIRKRVVCGHTKQAGRFVWSCTRSYNMHFWIDKRTQYTYTGRHRMPTTISSGGVGRGRARVYGEMSVRVGRKPRSSRRSPGTASRRGRSIPRQNGAPVGVHGRRPEATVTYMSVPPRPSIASLAAARCVTPDTLLRTAALGLPAPPPLAPHLKFGMLVALTLAALFLVGTKYYFDEPMVPKNSSRFSETSMVLLAMGGACGLGCLVLKCRPKAAPLQEPDRVTSTSRQPPPTLPATSSTSEPSPSVSDDVSLSTLLRNQPKDSPEAPPPYHIAVLLPTREASPPHYSDLS